MKRPGDHQQRGQAMVLAVVGMLVLAVGMYTTYSISRAVYEKIQLQNAADATAYSLATLEARSFNFIALTNRAMIANYVQMMEAETVLSQLTFYEGAAGWLADKLRLADTVIPGAAGLADSADAVYELLEKAVTAAETWAPRYIERETTKNHALFAVAAAVVLATSLQVGEGGVAFTAANDEDAVMSNVSWSLVGLNVASYGAAFDPASFGLGGAPDRLAARRVMTELVNATRIGSFGDGDYLVARQPLATLQAFADLKGRLSGIAGAFEVLGVLDIVLEAAGFVGTTKMLSDATGLPDLEQTEHDADDASFLNIGGALVAKDVAEIPGFAKKLASMTLTPSGSSHCRYERNGGLTGDVVCHAHHGPWRNLIGMRGGITPYLTFAPRLSGVAIDTTSFNQPDVWVLLHKETAALGTGGRVEDPQFAITQGGKTGHFDGRLGEGGLLGDGMHALARAQVYYHRPGAWQEMPNFFNPFWGARLAPKNAAVKRLLTAVNLPGGMAQLVADNLWMH